MTTMVRINANIREETIRNLMKWKFVKEDAEIAALENEVNEQRKTVKKLGYEAIFTKEQIKRMEELPAGWLPKTYSLRVRVEDAKDSENWTDTTVEFGDSHDKETWRVVPWKYSLATSQPAFATIIKSDHPYAVAFNEYKAKARELDELRKSINESRLALRRKALTIIESVTTIKRLLEIWPQVHEFLPEIVSGPSGGVPAQLIEEINEEFGLDKAAPKKE